MANQRNAGCMGIGFLGFGLVVLGVCGGPADPPSQSVAPPASSYESPVGSDLALPPTPASETFYIHGEVNVRRGPGKDFPIVRALSRGDSVQLGPRDANGWAELYDVGGAREGYVYRASALVRSTPPSAGGSAGESASGGSRSSAESRGYHTGPRGGCYYYSSSGRKQYVDRSYCN